MPSKMRAARQSVALQLVVHQLHGPLDGELTTLKRRAEELFGKGNRQLKAPFSHRMRAIATKP